MLELEEALTIRDEAKAAPWCEVVEMLQGQRGYWIAGGGWRGTWSIGLQIRNYNWNPVIVDTLEEWVVVRDMENGLNN